MELKDKFSYIGSHLMTYIIDFSYPIQKKKKTLKELHCTQLYIYIYIYNETG